MPTIEREAKLFEAGVYPDRNIEVTEDDLDRIIAGTAEAPIKVQHTNTVFDGSLGFVKSLYRKGKELFGRVCFEEEAFPLIKKAGARKLSVSIPKEKNMLKEVSLVTKPRIADAAYFSDDETIAVNTEIDVFALFASDISHRDIEEAIRREIDPKMEWKSSLEDTRDKTCVVLKDGVYTQYDYVIGDDGKAQLSNPTIVKMKKSWVPVSKAFSDEGDNEMPNLTDAEFAELKASAEKAEAAEKALAEQSDRMKKLEGDVAKFGELVTAMDAENKTKEDEIEKLKNDAKFASAETEVDKLIRAGRLAPAAKDQAIKLMMLDDKTVKFGDSDTSVADLLKGLLENSPKGVSFGESFSAEDNDEDGELAKFGGTALARRLGITDIAPERLKKLQEKYGITDK